MTAACRLAVIITANVRASASQAEQIGNGRKPPYWAVQ
jgi:hypothetical protein